MKKTSIPAFNTQKIKNLLEFLAEKSFWIFILLFLSSAYLIFSVLYQPIKSRKEFLVDEKANAVQFDEKSFNGSLEQWKIKEKRLLEINSKIYPDIFSKKMATSTSPASNTPTSTASSTTAPAIINHKL